MTTRRAKAAAAAVIPVDENIETVPIVVSKKAAAPKKALAEKTNIVEPVEATKKGKAAKKVVEAEPQQEVVPAPAAVKRSGRGKKAATEEVAPVVEVAPAPVETPVEVKEEAVADDGLGGITEQLATVSIGTKKTRGPRAKKFNDGRPKPALSAFLHFAEAARVVLKASHPSASPAEMLTLIGFEWKNTSAEDKQPYIEKAKADKERFEVEMKQWTEQNPGAAAALKEERQKKKEERKHAKMVKAGQIPPPNGPRFRPIAPAPVPVAVQYGVPAAHPLMYHQLSGVSMEEQLRYYQQLTYQLHLAFQQASSANMVLQQQIYKSNSAPVSPVPAAPLSPVPAAPAPVETVVPAPVEEVKVEEETKEVAPKKRSTRRQKN